MKHLIVATLCVAAALTGTSAIAAPVTFNQSKYGSFEYRNKGEDCEVWFRNAAGAPTRLISATFCSDDKMLPISPSSSLGGVAFPVASPSGTEFHLFAIPSARGGNATAACDYYGVVISAARAWASPVFQLDQCDATVDGMRVIEEKAGAWLSFRDPSSTVRAGAAYELRMGQLKIAPIPKKPRAVVSTANVVRAGALRGPYHYTNWKHVIQDGSNEYIIDEPGQCALDGAADSVVEMSGRLRTWSDGATDLTCVSIRVRK